MSGSYAKFFAEASAHLVESEARLARVEAKQGENVEALTRLTTDLGAAESNADLLEDRVTNLSSVVCARLAALEHKFVLLERAQEIEARGSPAPVHAPPSRSRLSSSSSSSSASSREPSPRRRSPEKEKRTRKTKAELDEEVARKVENYPQTVWPENTEPLVPTFDIEGAKVLIQENERKRKQEEEKEEKERDEAIRRRREQTRRSRPRAAGAEPPVTKRNSESTTKAVQDTDAKIKSLRRGLQLREERLRKLEKESVPSQEIRDKIKQETREISIIQAKLKQLE